VEGVGENSVCLGHRVSARIGSTGGEEFTVRAPRIQLDTFMVTSHGWGGGGGAGDKLKLPFLSSIALQNPRYSYIQENCKSCLIVRITVPVGISLGICPLSALLHPPPSPSPSPPPRHHYSRRNAANSHRRCWLRRHRYQQHQRYWWQNLPPELLIPVVPLDLQISPRILEKIRKDPNVVFRVFVEDDSWKKPEGTNFVTLSL
jgi:hypothetical protein